MMVVLPTGTVSPSFRVCRLRSRLEGELVVLLVLTGRVLDAKLRRQRMTVEELLGEVHLQPTAELQDIDFPRSRRPTGATSPLCEVTEVR